MSDHPFIHPSPSVVQPAGSSNLSIYACTYYCLTNRSPPTRNRVSGVLAVSAGYYHTCVVLTSGGVDCWGANSDGQLGTGDTNDRHTPTAVTGLGAGGQAWVLYVCRRACVCTSICLTHTLTLACMLVQLHIGHLYKMLSHISIPFLNNMTTSYSLQTIKAHRRLLGGPLMRWAASRTKRAFCSTASGGHFCPQRQAAVLLGWGTR